MQYLATKTFFQKLKNVVLNIVSNAKYLNETINEAQYLKMSN